MQKVKYMTKALLLEVAAEGDRISFNRQIAPSILPDVTEQLMPVAVVMLHDHICGEPVEQHYRCHVRFRLKGDPSVQHVLIDMTKEPYAILSTEPWSGDPGA